MEASCTEVDSILSVETGHVNEVHTAANDITGGERWSIWLTTAR